MIVTHCHCNSWHGFLLCVLLGAFCTLLKPQVTKAASTNSTVSQSVAEYVSGSGCLKPDAKCLPDGSLGDCCSGFCFKAMGRESGYCSVKNCLNNGAECHMSASLGFCCSQHCAHYWGHTLGVCADRTPNNTYAGPVFIPEDYDDAEDDPTSSSAPIPATVAAVDLAPVYGLIALVLVVVVFGGVAIWVRDRKKGGREWSPSLGTGSGAGSRKMLGSDALFPATYARLKAVIESKPYKAYEVPEEDFSVDTSSSAILGQGAFSMVLRAIVRGRGVAAKTVPDRVRDESVAAAYLEPLLQELKIRIDVGPHENIVSLVGAHTQRLIYGVCYVFVEICTNGSLHDYINLHMHEFFDGDGTGDPRRRDPVSGYLLPPLMGREPGIISGKHFRNWCADISAGMSHLASLGIVHGDLAARNILLTDTMVAKISDFGLSKKLYDSCNKYVTGNRNVRVPWQHMAPESLTRLKFWTPSDVWAFGVTMWELYSLGESPYSPMEWTPEFVSLLTEQGVRLQQPVHATDETYEIIMACWALDAGARPSFDEIHAVLLE